MSIPELNTIFSVQINRDDSTYIQGNMFTAYTMCSNNFTEINRAYMKLRLDHADARHIVGAWYIPGAKDYDVNDGCDDGESGAGAALARLLKEHEIQNRVVFVVRKCGDKLQQERIKQYIQAATNVINRFSENHLASKNQHVDQKNEADQSAKDEQTDRPLTYAGAVKTPPKVDQSENATRQQNGRQGRGGRGTGRGGGRGRAGYRRGRGRGGSNNRTPLSSSDKEKQQFQVYMPPEIDSQEKGRDEYDFAAPHTVSNMEWTQGM